MIFFGYKLHHEEISVTMVEQDPGKFHAFLIKWLKVKVEKNLTNAANTESHLRTILNEMENIYLESNIGVMGKRRSNQDGLIARIDASPVCPITGKALTDSNVEIDHIHPVSSSETTDLQAMSKSANQLKSSMTVKTSGKIHELQSVCKNQKDS